MTPLKKGSRLEVRLTTKLAGAKQNQPERKQSLFVHKFPTHGVILRDLDHDAFKNQTDSTEK